jgi:hypothetical protein
VLRDSSISSSASYTVLTNLFISLLSSLTTTNIRSVIESLELPTSSNNKSLRKLPPINIGERSPELILLPNTATLSKLFSEFYNIIDTKK